MRRCLLCILALTAALLAGCGDDGPPSDGTAVNVTTPPSTTEPAECADLADRYVEVARNLFDREGTPSDALVDRTRQQFVEFDGIAATAGCGPTYLQGVCDGLDALSAEGILVITGLTTAQCI